MKKSTGLLLFALALTVLFGAVMSERTGSGDQQERKYRISAIIYGNDKDRWAFMREGLNQGASELPVELSFLSMSEEESAEEQIRVITQEIENGAEGILLAAADSTALNETVSEAAEKVPILTIETDVEDNARTIGYLAADDYAMGKCLGERIKREYPDRRICLVHEFTQRNSVQRRYDGLRDACGGNDEIILWERGEGDYGLNLYVEKMIREEGDGAVVVALDAVALEETLDAYERLEQNSDGKAAQDGFSMESHPLYGIGATDKIVYYLDRGWINGIVFQNEFRIGYAGLEQMVSYLKGHPTSLPEETTVIEYYEADRENMYETDLQRLLFPIVQ